MVSVNDEVTYTGENEDGVGDVKKLGLIVLIIALVRIGSFVYYETKVLDEPVIIASNYDEGMGMITVSYITNRLDPHDVAWVEMGGLSFGPDSYMDMPFFDSHQTSAVKFADYTYHSIYYSQMHIGYSVEDGSLEIEDEMTVHFTDSSRQQVPVEGGMWDERNFLTSSYSSSGSKQSFQTYIVERPFELEEIEIEAGQKIVEFKVNTNQIPVPLEESLLLKDGDRVSLTLLNRNATYLGDSMHLFFVGKDEENGSVKIHIQNSIDAPPSRKWIKERIEEAQGK